MEPEALDLSNAAKGLAILSAIPVVLYALWAEYFSQYIEHLNQETPDYDREAESEKARMTALFVILFEFIMFLGSSEVRHAYPIPSQLIFIADVVILLFIQSKLEKKIHIAGEKKTDDILGIIAKAILFWTAGTALYLMVLVASIRTAAWIAERAHLPGPMGTSLMILGGLAGVIFGLVLNFFLSPFVLQKMLPTSPIEDPQLKSLLDGCFSKAKLKPPRFWVIELEKIKLVTLVITGAMRGRWVFQPGLFLSRIAIQQLTTTELQAVVNNQISHIALRHLSKRFFYCFGLIIFTAAVAISSVWISRKLFSDQIAFEVVGPASALISFFSAFHLLALQAKRHILMADLFCIEKLGVAFEDLATALRKLDFLPNPDNNPIQMPHPETEQRLQLLLDELKRRQKPESNSSHANVA